MSNLGVNDDLWRAQVVFDTVRAELTTPPLSGRTVVLSPWARLRMTLEAPYTRVVMDVQAEVHEARASMITWPVSGMALATLGPLTYGYDLTVAWATHDKEIINYVLRDLSMLYRPRFNELREHLVTTPIAWEVTDAMLRLGER